MKTFLFIFIFVLSLKADTVYQGKCVKSFSLMVSTSIYIVYYNDTTVTVAYTTDILNTLINNQDKWQYIAPQCKPIPKNNTLGMTNEQYSFMMAFLSSLTGILIGFTILFFAIFLTIKVGSRK